MDMHVNEEQRATKIGGIFDSRQMAETAVKCLMLEGEFAKNEVELISPEDRRWDQKVEPEDRGIALTLLKSHFKFGVAGMALGSLTTVALLIWGPAFAESSALLLFVALSTVGLFGGLLLAGAFSLRPDHDLLIQKVRHAIKTGHYAVVVHVKNHAEKLRARQLMKRHAGEFAETI